VNISLPLILKWKSSVFYEATQLLNRSERKKVFLVIIIQVAMGLLDLVGVMLIGVIGALAVTGVSSSQPGNRVSAFLDFAGLSDASLQFQVGVIGLATAMILIGKTIFTVIFTRKILFFLSLRAAEVSARMVRKLLNQSLVQIQSRSLQTSLYATTSGVSVMTVGVLGVFVSLVSDLSLLLVLIFGLFLVDSTMAFGTIIIFSTIAYLLWRLMHLRAKELGENSAEVTLKSAESLFEVLMTFREIYVRDRKGFYAEKIGNQRRSLANLHAEMTFMPSISKYVIEIVVVIAAVLICAYQFWVNDANRAVAILSIFLAATTRIAPAILRIQSGAIGIKSSIASAKPTLELLRELGWQDSPTNKWTEPDYSYSNFSAGVCVTDLKFKYPGNKVEVIKDVNLVIPPGSFVGFVGSSGSGKTTLVDLILGLLEPDSGEVTISGLEPQVVIKKFPGAIGYIPQDVVIVNGSIRRNVTLGFEDSEISDVLIWDALKVAHLDKFVESLPYKLDTEVGDRGTKLSGGQRQRLGIARAMVTKPKLLVLDEATSSLDSEIELNISDAIQDMRGEATILMIAHRLSTIRNCDAICFLSNGKIVDIGTFEELKARVPQFEKQASLMGL